MNLTQAVYVPFVLVEKAAELTGYSRSAIEAKIAKGQWVEGREWVKAPDGRRMVSMKGYEEWVLRGLDPQSGKRTAGSGPSPA